MTKFKPSFRGLIGILAILALISFVYTAGVFKGLPPKASAEVEDWAQHSEFVVSGSQQTTGTALIVTANSLTLSTQVASGGVGCKANVKAIVMAGGTAGIYTFFSGSTVTGAHQVGQFYLAANTPVAYNVGQFRGGMRSLVAGEGLYCVGPGVLTYTLVNRVDFNQ
jgi:hypothetical protein